MIVGAWPGLLAADRLASALVRQTPVGMKWYPRMGMPARPMLRDGGDHVVELFVAALLAEHDLVVEGDGDVFERHQSESGFALTCALSQAARSSYSQRDIRRAVPRRVHLDVIDSTLLDVGQQRVVEESGTARVRRGWGVRSSWVAGIIAGSSGTGGSGSKGLAP